MFLPNTRHAHVVSKILSRTTRPSRLSMPRPFSAGFAVFRAFCRCVAAWDIAVSMAFAAPARFPPDANVAGPRSRQSPFSNSSMPPVSLTRENRPKNKFPKSAHQPWSKMGWMSTSNGGKSNVPKPQRTRQPESLVLTYLETWIVCLAARLGNQQLDIRIRHAEPRQLWLKFAPL